MLGSIALKSFEFDHIPGLDRSGCTSWSAVGIYSHEIAFHNVGMIFPDFFKIMDISRMRPTASGQWGSAEFP